MKKILVIIGLVVFLFLNIVVTFADHTIMKAPQPRESGGTNMLPEATITCGQNEGRCWDGYCKNELGIFALPMGYMVCDDFRGNMMYSCVNDMPC